MLLRQEFTCVSVAEPCQFARTEQHSPARPDILPNSKAHKQQSDRQRSECQSFSHDGLEVRGRKLLDASAEHVQCGIVPRYGKPSYLNTVDRSLPDDHYRFEQVPDVQLLFAHAEGHVHVCGATLVQRLELLLHGLQGHVL